MKGGYNEVLCFKGDCLLRLNYDSKRIVSLIGENSIRTDTLHLNLLNVKLQVLMTVDCYC